MPIHRDSRRRPLRSSTQHASYVLAAAFAALTVAASASEYVQSKGRWLVDPAGRVLILHSMNVGQSCKRPPFLPWQTREEITILRAWGFDSVRYLISWEALEPQPGQYNDAYLSQVEERLAWCRQAGLRVIVDMHQDIYSVRYGGNGAPRWACIDGGTPFQRIKGAWYLTYAAPAVIQAFDSFWANAPGPGGVGIQDRFVAAWQHVARRLRDDTNVIGYDLLNEPYYGSAVYPIFFSLVLQLGQELGPEVREKWQQLLTQPEGAVEVAGEVVAQLHARGRLLSLLDVVSAPAMQFEQRSLQPFYEKLVAGIREVDPHHICFFEPAGGAASSTRLRPGLKALRDAQGRPFANTAYAPHHYDLWADLRLPDPGPTELVLPQLRRATQAGDAMNVPTWFGEWGGPSAYSPGASEMVLAHLDGFDALFCGWAWWQYGRDFSKLSFRHLLSRPHAETIAGMPTRMHCSTTAFELSFDPLSAGGETTIWVPPSTRTETHVKLHPEGKAQARRDPAGFVRVTCPHGARQCTITIELTDTP